MADIAEHSTAEGKLYCCAIKDVFTNGIVGWAINERMKARLVVAAICSPSKTPSNSRPSKALSWKTPAEVLDEQLWSLHPAGVAPTG